MATSASKTLLAWIWHHLPPSWHLVVSRKTILIRLIDAGISSQCPLRSLPLTPHHTQCWLDFCSPQASCSLTNCRCDFQRWILIQTQCGWPLHMCEEAASPVVQSSIWCREAFSDYTRYYSVGSDLLRHTITSSPFSSWYDYISTARSYVDSISSTECAAYAVKLPRCHLSSKQYSSIYCMILPVLSSWIRYTSIACLITRPHTNRTHQRHDGKTAATISEYWRMNCWVAKIYRPIHR